MANHELSIVWNDFCERLKSAGEIIQNEASGQANLDTLDHAEGYRYLSRLLRAGLENQVESSNPYYPRFYQLANDTIKIGNDNPDNIYHNANLDGRLDYLITGTRGTVDYISFGTKAGRYETSGTMEPSGQLDGSDLHLDEQGNFEIIVSSTPKPGNWLPMIESSSSLIIRQTFANRSNEQAARYSIGCLNRPTQAQFDANDFAKRLLASADFVNGTATLFANWMQSYSAHINQLPYDDQTKCQQAGGDASIQYLQSYWQLANDEALLIHAKEIPDCKTWNFQLSNYWMESLDYRHHCVSVNKHTAHYENDGSVKIVVAHQPPMPEFQNYIETCGHTKGGMLWRWVEADTDRKYPVDCKVVPFSSLKA